MFSIYIRPRPASAIDCPGPLSGTSMQSYPTAPIPQQQPGAPQHTAPRRQPYGSHPSFSLGSAPPSHAAYQPEPPANATGSIYARPGYAYSPSMVTTLPPLPAYAPWASGAFYKYPQSALPPPAPPSMAIAYLSPTGSAPSDHAPSSEHSSGESPPPPPGDSQPPEGAKEKKRHSCWMCHKSFDRPSTLRKHLLVHTGEKAYACDTCGRRFGVLSNLNRHTKRCAQRPVNQAASAKAAAAAPSP
ncbi:hypothetical protein WOLCODRAFT_159897, partial [Wolfiporia cocos MD-104 SS10]